MQVSFSLDQCKVQVCSPMFVWGLDIVLDFDGDRRHLDSCRFSFQISTAIKSCQISFCPQNYFWLSIYCITLDILLFNRGKYTILKMYSSWKRLKMFEFPNQFHDSNTHPTTCLFSHPPFLLSDIYSLSFAWSDTYLLIEIKELMERSLCTPFVLCF